MKRFPGVLSLLILALTIAQLPLANTQTTSVQQIPIPPLPAFHPQQPKRIELPNGMVFFLQEDHELPLIDGIARIRGGARSEPAAKAGMLDLYGEVWRTGGTKSQTGDQLDDYLEVRAAKVETGASEDSTTISLSCLTDDFDDVFKVFRELLREPEFRDDKLDLAKREADDSISRRNDEITAIANRESTKLAYGAQNPYARQPEYATVAAVARQNLLDWYGKHVHPNNIIFGIVGDFDSAAMEGKLREAFGAWPKGPAVKQPEIQFEPAKPGYYLIPKSDVNQSNIRMVELGTRRDNPDYYAIQIFNQAFGGSFSARLIQVIRTEKGLAYNVGGGVGTAFDHPGIERYAMGTKSQTTIESIRALMGQVEDLKKNPISEAEIKRSKDAILNSFVFNFDSPEKVMRERMAYEFYGYPADFLERYRAGIEKVTTEDVARVVEKYVHAGQLAVLVVGNTSEFDKPLSSLGSVTNIDITIPSPQSEKQAGEAKPAGSNPEGKALVAKVAEAMGGEAKLKTIKSLRVAMNMTQKTPQGDMPLSSKVTIVYPDRMQVEAQGPMGPFTLVVSPEAGFVSVASMGVQNLPDSQKQETLAQIKRDLVYVAQHADDPEFSFAASGSEKISDVDARIVDVNGPGVAMRWYVDAKTGHVVRETYETVGRSGPVQAETDLANWKTTDGVTVPYSRKTRQGGEDASTAELQSIQINPTVDPKIFEKPAAEAKTTQ